MRLGPVSCLGLVHDGVTLGPHDCVADLAPAGLPLLDLALTDQVQHEVVVQGIHLDRLEVATGLDQHDATTLDPDHRHRASSWNRSCGLARA